MTFLWALVWASGGGALVGCLTGLLPGLHVNTLSVLLLALAPAVAPHLENLGVEVGGVPLFLGAFILAITISHTFVNILPATYLGAPDESTALSILPAHRLLLNGHGYRAIQLNAYASFFAVAVSLALLWPVRWLLTGPLALWSLVRPTLPFLLLLMAAFLVWREPARLGPKRLSARTQRTLAKLGALLLFAASGLYGILGFHLPYTAWVPVPPSPLLPMLSGLFGAATLLEAFSQRARIPHQFLDTGGDQVHPKGAMAALGVGVAAGATMSILPGLTNATATALASVARRANDAEILVSLGAVNTANALFNLLVLYLLGRARSGAVVALNELVPVDSWTGTIPSTLAAYLFVAVGAAAVSLVATLLLGRWAARRVHRVPYGGLVGSVMLYSAAVVWVFSGPLGFLVYLVGAALGLVPVRLGLQRTHLTGVLLVPVLGHLWGVF